LKSKHQGELLFMKLPLARTENIVMQEVGDDLLIYDLIINKAICLNRTSAIVYRACDGKTPFDELKRRSNFTDELIFLALDELRKVSLLPREYESPLAGLTRREAIKKAALTSIIALPVITTITAPKAVQAQSGGGALCLNNNCEDGNLSCNGGAGGCAATFQAQGGGECCTSGGNCFCTPIGTCVTQQGGVGCPSQSLSACARNSCANNNAACNGGAGGCATTFQAQGGGECCTAGGACFCTPIGTCVTQQGGQVCP
jgi:hypothetical protein